MSTSPLVSIVIPTFNQIDYLPVCIDHCLFQTYNNLELIIVDGGSTDSTKEYLSNLKNKIETTTVNPVTEMNSSGDIIRQEKAVYPQNRQVNILCFDGDIGATRTYNEGLKLAKGKYCTYIVGDDIPYPHMIEHLVKAIEYSGADFVYSDMNLVDDKGQMVRQMRLPDYDFYECFAKWYHIGVSHLYKTKWHDIVGFMDEENYKSANDYDHYLRFAMNGAAFYHLPDILYSIRHHNDARKTGQHTDKNYMNLLEESKKCAFRARAWLSQQTRNAE